MDRTVVLLDRRDEGGSRHLEAACDANGDLVIRGQDLGAAVERFFGEGIREYEWTWTVRRADVAKLAAALDAAGDVLAALRQRFGDGESSAGIRQLLEKHGVPFESWSRLGD